MIYNNQMGITPSFNDNSMIYQNIQGPVSMGPPSGM